MVRVHLFFFMSHNLQVVLWEEPKGGIKMDKRQQLKRHLIIEDCVIDCGKYVCLALLGGYLILGGYYLGKNKIRETKELLRNLES